MDEEVPSALRMPIALHEQIGYCNRCKADSLHVDRCHV